MNSTDIQNIHSLLSKPKKIAIVPHRNPDGDAYGSSLGLYLFLKEMKHDVHVVSPNEAPAFLNWLPGREDVVIFEEDKANATRIIEEAQIIFIMDFNALHRVGEPMQKVLESVKPVYIMIDHHPEPDNFADYTYSDTKVCSTCQMLYQFYEMLGVTDKITKDMATCLYTGILTDTGSFRFPSTTSKTHLIVADLLDRGVEHARIYNRIYENSINRLHLLGRALENLKYLKKYKTAYITLSNSELHRFNFKKGDTEGFVNYALSLEDTVLAAIFIEDKQQGIIKISFRSVGDFSVNDLARKYFNGGGHINAAGGRSELSLKETIHRFTSILPQYEEQLNKDHE
ncbi:MAG: bifunctional oligoribonuclease/PAP phosphatase NrnA [Flavobacteriia bacterium]|nr:MAG: bifunctional oligoribonuclease/PAP phosphatase NrnA [Flavobacteriia bacterium]